MLLSCHQKGTDNITEYISQEFGNGVAVVCDNAIILFMICVYSVMVAGAGELAYDLIGINSIFAMLVFNCVTFLSFIVIK